MLPPDASFKKNLGCSNMFNGDSCGGEFAQMQIHSWMPAFSNSKFANPKLVCMQYGVTSMLLITAHTPAVMWVQAIILWDHQTGHLRFSKAAPQPSPTQL
jgi:hypothetical protein